MRRKPDLPPLPELDEGPTYPVGYVPPELLASGEDGSEEDCADEDCVDETTGGGPVAALFGAEEATSGLVMRSFLVEPSLGELGMVELPEPLTEELRLDQLGADEADSAELRLTLLNRARREVQQGDLAEAERSLERAEALNPGDPLIAVHRAWLRFVSGETFTAGWEAEQAFAEAGDDPEVARLVAALAEEMRGRNV
mgnify:CR=1 FL=1